MMSLEKLPDWNSQGFLPAILPGEEGHSFERSPYSIDLMQLVERFGTSINRLMILKGFLEYRQSLHSLGLVEGMQWLDGSFVENIEVLEGRPPNDIDVVTFAYIPDGETQASLYAKNQTIFNQAQNKQNYKVDGYYLFLGRPVTPSYIKEVTYWYSMWSHTRNDQWKGFVQLDLNAAEDAEALALISSRLEVANEC